MITAGHCAGECDEPKFVVLNGYDLRKRDQEIAIKVKTIQRHPEFNLGNGLSYDVALVTLSQCIAEGATTLGFMCLPTDPADVIEENDLALIAGWGFVNETTLPRYRLVKSDLTNPT